MLLSFLTRRGKIGVFPKGVRTIFLSMAASTDESNKENVADGEVEQIVTMEKVVAADNKGIDYDKLISKFSWFVVIQIEVEALEKCSDRCVKSTNQDFSNKYVRLYYMSTSPTNDSKQTELNQDCSSQLPGCLPYIGIKIIL